MPGAQCAVTSRHAGASCNSKSRSWTSRTTLDSIFPNKQTRGESAQSNGCTNMRKLHACVLGRDSLCSSSCSSPAAQHSCSARHMLRSKMMEECTTAVTTARGRILTWILQHGVQHCPPSSTARHKILRPHHSSLRHCRPEGVVFRDCHLSVMVSSSTLQSS